MSAGQAEEETSSKRQRTKINQSINFVCDKDYYLDDGNIVLVAEDTAFKVHKSVLSRNSVIFRDMFLANANSSVSSQRYGGCEILRLSDSKQDVVCLLRALYDNIVLSPHELIELSCLLRISNKYLIHRLLKRTLETIEKAIPITYEGYKASFRTPGHAAYGHNELNIGVAAIMAGIDIFLPILYYEFSTFLDPGEFELLPASSIAKILTGIPPILEYLPNVFKIVKARQSASDTCRSPTCKTAWEVLSSMLEYHVARPSLLYYPLDFLIFMCGRNKLPKQCLSCRNARIGLLDAEARKIWDKLPKIYNIAKSWDELREKYDKIKESDDEVSVNEMLLV